MGANDAFGTCAGLVDDHHGSLVWDGKCQWVTQFGWAKLQGGTNECRMEAYFLKMRMLDFEYRMVVRRSCECQAWRTMASSHITRRFRRHKV